MRMDISNFYLMTHLYQPEFIHIKLNDIPNEVVNEATKNDSIYIRAKHGMYSLPQAGLLANELIKKISKQANWYLAFGNTTKTNTVHTVCQQLRHKIRQQRTCPTSQKHTV